VAQIGVLHEHANGKMYTLRKLPDIFEVAGYVDDREFATTPHIASDVVRPYEGLRKMTLDKVLSDSSIQAVTVEVPNNELVPMALRCMERNLAMHMDKPAGLDLSLYKMLLDGCAERRISFQMGYMFRGNPAFRFALEAIRNRWIGEVCELELDMNHCYGGEPYQEYLGKFPGGIMFNLGCHLIDFVVAALGAPQKVTPFLQSAPGDPAHILNNCLAVLTYPHATVTLRACSRGRSVAYRRMWIVGTKGEISLSPLERFDGKPLEMSLNLSQGAAGLPPGTHTLRFTGQDDRYAVQLKEWAGMIRGETQSPYSFEHDYLVHEITLAAAGYQPWRS
ncbi:MAG: Gfo/Idh/MocA family oxidoreductase, partial [Victivallales bacterium]|nr:Gfo/Idh/MocA family oxidoreductase [Victivallales bacterium]